MNEHIGARLRLHLGGRDRTRRSTSTRTEKRRIEKGRNRNGTETETDIERGKGLKQGWHHGWRPWGGYPRGKMQRLKPVTDHLLALNRVKERLEENQGFQRKLRFSLITMSHPCIVIQ
jgi:hypothetical protein